MPSTPFAYSQVGSRTFASFHVGAVAAERQAVFELVRGPRFGCCAKASTPRGMLEGILASLAELESELDQVVGPSPPRPNTSG